jgi:DNA-binding response OmpR family regulator
VNIVVIEDNDNLRQATVAMLTHHGHWVTGLVCAEDVDDMRLDPPPDLFLVDLNLPGEDGLSLAKRLRTAQPLVGIIMVTARGLLGDKLAGYESGADIYLAKPVDPEELLAAVKSLSRRLLNSARLQQRSVTSNELFLDQIGRTLRGPQGEETLSECETAILVGLSRAPGTRLQTWQVMHTLNEDPETYSKSALEVRMVRLRRKLVKVGANRGCLPAVRSFGYQLAVNVVLT